MSADIDVTVRRGYTECRFGQMHFIEGRPAAVTGLKTPLILLHQNPSSSMEYRFLLKDMAQDRRVIAFDTPGNGMSDRPPEAQSIAGYAAATAAAARSIFSASIPAPITSPNSRCRGPISFGVP
jgi:pimeloyl-ACP methyl ester carboxylesterase